MHSFHMRIDEIEKMSLWYINRFFDLANSIAKATKDRPIPGKSLVEEMVEEQGINKDSF